MRINSKETVDDWDCQALCQFSFPDELTYLLFAKAQKVAKMPYHQLQTFSQPTDTDLSAERGDQDPKCKSQSFYKRCDLALSGIGNRISWLSILL